jgi:hypothetical protein
MVRAGRVMNFTEYCWSFYGPNEIHGDFFDNNLTRDELDEAIKERQAQPDFDGFDGTFDREIVRDIMLVRRGLAPPA